MTTTSGNDTTEGATTTTTTSTTTYRLRTRNAGADTEDTARTTPHSAHTAGSENTTGTTRTATPGVHAANGHEATTDAPRTGPEAPAAAAATADAATVPRPRRSAGTRRPLGPAGSGPGPAGRGHDSAGRGPSRSTPRRDRATGADTANHRPGAGNGLAAPAQAPGAPLPTVGAQRRAQEGRPHLWFAHQLVLTLSGQRPVHALLGHALPAAYDRLAELAPQAPLRPRLGPGRRGPVPTVRECGLCRPGRGVIEAFARIATGERLRALAFRLELGADSRWRCAALDIGPAPAPAAWSPAP